MPKVNESVRKEIRVQVPKERAFKVFTSNIGRWWPTSHHIGRADLANVVLEPKENGRWYEIGTDGSQCDWGRVLIWNPPSVVVLAWQINAEWSFDPNLITEVEIRFEEHAPKETLVILEHRNIERFGVKKHEVKTAFESENGWGGILKQFAQAAQSEGL